MFVLLLDETVYRYEEDDAAQAGEEVLVPTSRTIIMDTLWVLLVKCKLRKSLKK